MNILLAVSGSISAYKTIDLARGLVKLGHEVKVILTQGALEFVVPNLYSYLGAKEVFYAQDDFKHKNVLHVDLARWCDVLVIAPTSANTLSRLARGEASDLLTSVFLAIESQKPILVFPAMNTNMLHHPFTKQNMDDLKKLKSLSQVFISPTDSGVLACEEVGEGKLPSVEEMIELIPIFAEASKAQKNHQKHFLITTGATIVPLDPVRYLTNSSSGLTGFYLATSLLSLGHQVTVIAGKMATFQLNLLQKHPQYKLERVATVTEMKDAVLKLLPSSDVYLSSAAISDIEFDVSSEKIKKDTFGTSLPFKKADDLLKIVLGKKSASQKIVGFAAETNTDDQTLNKKFQSKPVDLLVATKVHNGLIHNAPMSGFNNPDADYRFLTLKGFVFEGKLDKKNLAHKILEFIQ